MATGASTSVHVGEKGSAPLPDDVRSELERLRVEAAEPVRAAADAARLVREAYPFRVDVRARFGDLDTNRHVNNVALAGWYLDALAELHLDVLGYPTGGPLDSLAPSSLRIDYLAEVHYPAIHQLRVGVVELDETSVRYACGLFDGPRCIGLAEATGGLSPDEDPELGKRLGRVHAPGVSVTPAAAHLGEGARRWSPARRPRTGRAARWWRSPRGRRPARSRARSGRWRCPTTSTAVDPARGAASRRSAAPPGSAPSKPE